MINNGDILYITGLKLSTKNIVVNNDTPEYTIKEKIEEFVNNTIDTTKQQVEELVKSLFAELIDKGDN